MIVSDEYHLAVKLVHAFLKIKNHILYSDCIYNFYIFHVSNLAHARYGTTFWIEL